MTILTKLLILATSIHQALACVHAYGYIDHNPPEIPAGGHYAKLEDNGGTVCEGAIGRLDQDGHYAIDCIPGYVWAITKDLGHSYYGYGSVSFQWDQHVETGSFDCGTCVGEDDHCHQCTTRQFDTHVYC